MKKKQPDSIRRSQGRRREGCKEKEIKQETHSRPAIGHDLACGRVRRRDPQHHVRYCRMKLWKGVGNRLSPVSLGNESTGGGKKTRDRGPLRGPQIRECVLRRIKKRWRKA